MDKKDFYFLGKITKISGYKGYLIFFFDVDDPSQYAFLEAVFIDLNEELIPFVIKSIQFTKGKNALVQLEDVSDEISARALVGTELYLPLSFFQVVE